jgi:hypothetical protein
MTTNDRTDAIHALRTCMQRLDKMHRISLRGDCRDRTPDQEGVTSLSMVLADVLCELSCALHANKIPQRVLEDMIVEARKAAAEHHAQHHGAG